MIETDPQPMPDARLRGFGLGLRPQHYPAFLETWPALDFLEIISENFMVRGGRPLKMLDTLRER